MIVAPAWLCCTSQFALSVRSVSVDALSMSQRPAPPVWLCARTGLSDDAQEREERERCACQCTCQHFLEALARNAN
ncbi:hypothetical protein K466DRAFT_76390 [Polyporus arcularius HHB13444]|uniref:Secreted protein n=1 Tax=Polyporus arcularius HHB13444 TaxID=1314778 RepID=A0A5C3PF11_9APHY|nr:hypothetical protein K466DRAFT_76390 [Polyporus arcularius HHB13444]